MEREKQELQDFLERDNKAMRDRMSQEEEERQRKEREMQVRNPGGKIPNFFPPINQIFWGLLKINFR